MTTSRTLRLALVFTMASALGGCAAERRQDARVTGKRLVAAGFTVEGPDSPESAERLRVLPALTIVPQREDGTTVYRFADPYVCDCVYVGDEDAYLEYKRIRQIAEDPYIPLTVP